jgi:hypothetical protein
MVGVIMFILLVFGFVQYYYNTIMQFLCRRNEMSREELYDQLSSEMVILSNASKQLSTSKLVRQGC